MSTPTRYRYSIKSICDIHPELPKRLGIVHVHLPKIVENASLNPDDIDRAHALVKYLEAIYELEADLRVTKAVINTARNRARAIENAHAEAQFGPPPTSVQSWEVEPLQSEETPLPHEVDGRDDDTEGAPVPEADDSESPERRLDQNDAVHQHENTTVDTGLKTRTISRYEPLKKYDGSYII